MSPAQYPSSTGKKQPAVFAEGGAFITSSISVSTVNGPSISSVAGAEPSPPYPTGRSAGEALPLAGVCPLHPVRHSRKQAINEKAALLFMKAHPPFLSCCPLL